MSIRWTEEIKTIHCIIQVLFIQSYAHYFQNMHFCFNSIVFNPLDCVSLFMLKLVGQTSWPLLCCNSAIFYISIIYLWGLQREQMDLETRGREESQTVGFILSSNQQHTKNSWSSSFWSKQLPTLEEEIILKPESIHYCLFQNKTEGTIWKEIDDLRVFKVLDLEEIQSIFSAYQKPQVSHTKNTK